MQASPACSARGRNTGHAYLWQRTLGPQADHGAARRIVAFQPHAEAVVTKNR
jgi:hypothetical protein